MNPDSKSTALANEAWGCMVAKSLLKNRSESYQHFQNAIHTLLSCVQDKIGNRRAKSAQLLATMCGDPETKELIKSQNGIKLLMQMSGHIIK